jgi:DnaJ-class molecular chaperone
VRVALDCHPDRRPIDPDCLDRFCLASEAYEILTRFRPDGRYRLAALVGEAAQGEGHPSEAPEGSYPRWWWEQYKDLFI